LADHETDVRRAQRAQEILNDEIFRDAIARLRDCALDAFRTASPNDLAALQTARLMYDATEHVIAELANIMRDGQMAARKLADVKKPAASYRPGHARFGFPGVSSP